jgi:hypothetical protein
MKSLFIIALACFSLEAVSLHAQEPAKSENKKARLRCFADLGERGGKTTYSLAYTNSKTKPGDAPKTVFTRINGGFCSSMGIESMVISAGVCTFTLSEDGGQSVHLSEKLEADTMYSLLAVLDGGRPVLRLVREFPLVDAEQPGVVIHNLKSEKSLDLSIGTDASVRIPFSLEKSYFLPSTQITGPLAVHYLSERGLQRERSIDYSGSGRMIGVFLRNSYGQISFFTFPTELPKD